MISVKSYGGNRRSCNGEGAAGEANWGSSALVLGTQYPKDTHGVWLNQGRDPPKIASDKRRAH